MPYTLPAEREAALLARGFQRSQLYRLIERGEALASASVGRTFNLAGVGSVVIEACTLDGLRARPRSVTVVWQAVVRLPSGTTRTVCLSKLPRDPNRVRRQRRRAVSFDQFSNALRWDQELES